MKVLDVHPFLYGLRQNIAMLNRLGNEMESIHRSVEGLVALEDSLKGEGGNAIRAFYADCHLPFLQFFTTFQAIFSNVLKRMEGALDALESDPSGIIHERFLEGEIEHGLRNIVQLTESLTSEANSFMSQVADIVALPHLDDSEVQYGVRNAKIKRDDTITKLHEFDATQTTALMPIEHDLMTMESWIADIEGLFTDGLTDIHFPASHWTAISSKNKLKTDLALRSTAKAGLPVMTGVDGQPTTTLGTLLAGGNTIRFGYGIINGTGSLYGPSILSLPGMSTQASPIDRLSEKSTSEDEQLKVLFAALAKQPPVGNQKNDYPIDPNTGDYAFTFEGMRKVVGGNGSGTPDGFAPYAVAAFDFYTEDIGTMLSADATANQRLEAAAFTFIKPAKGLGMVHDASKAKDVGKVIDIDKPLLPGEGKVGTYEELIDAGTRGDNITPHHMPSAKYMQTNTGVHKNDGVS
ncbi:MAG: LXG domain-containing protein, partial [Sporosarcina sp.]